MRKGLRLLVAAAFGLVLLASTASAAEQGVRAHVLTATTGPPITQFSVGDITTNSPTKIVEGPDGNIWFIDDNGNGYGKITPDGVVADWTWDNAGDGANRNVDGLAAGPDGNVWYTLCTGSPYVPSIAKVSPSGVFTDYTPNTPGHFFQGGCPYGITAGPDGNMWFTDANYVGKITTGGQITEYDVLPSNDILYHIVAGPDGDLWATETDHDLIAQISTGGALVKLYQLPSNRGVAGIVVGPDHNLWLTEPGADMVGKLTTTGVLTEYPTPAAFAEGDDGITVGPDGNIWFTQCAAGDVAKITTGGVVTEYLSGAGLSCPNGIAAGSDGNIWFADETTGMIDRVSPNWVLVQCVVPKLVGKKLAAARSAIGTANCAVGRVKKAASKKKSGVVISQSPKPGQKLAKLGKVNLVVSKGKK
jgi:streptogramin lyase